MLVGTGVDVDFNQTKGLVGLAINQEEEAVDDTVSASLEFPFAAYKTSISRAQWNINAKTIAMKAGSLPVPPLPPKGCCQGEFESNAQTSSGGSRN